MNGLRTKSDEGYSIEAGTAEEAIQEKIQKRKKAVESRKPRDQGERGTDKV
jgi:hypothetical protein